MRNAREVLDEVTNWAVRNEEVRTVMLTSSRATTNNISDLLSDYDIEIAVNDSNTFLENEQWLSTFGDILTIIRVDETFNLRMVLYKDYVRIDFRIYSVNNFKQYIEQPKLPDHWDIGYVVLCDKDKITVNLPPPAYSAFTISKPSEKEFLATVTDFWWDTTYVAKCLWRDELFYAKYMLDNIIRFSYLEKMIEWYTASCHDWKITTNKHGRFFKHFLDSETWAELGKTFSGSNMEDNWSSLFATTKLFRKLAETVAAQLGYLYNIKVDEEIAAYLEKVRMLEKTASDIN